MTRSSAGGDECELVIVTTDGDVSQASLAQIGGTGVFAERAARGAARRGVRPRRPLAEGPADRAGAGPRRRGRSRRARTRATRCAPATASPSTRCPPARRSAPARPAAARSCWSAGPTSTCVDLRGNVDTRLGQRRRDGRLDAVVLSLAGLTRLGRLDAVTEVLALDGWPTAAGQGALALEIRESDAATLATGSPSAVAVAVRRLADPLVRGRRIRRAHRARPLEAGCAAPIGVASAVADGVLLPCGRRVHEPGGGRHLDRRIERDHDRCRRGRGARRCCAPGSRPSCSTRAPATLAPLGGAA